MIIIHGGILKIIEMNIVSHKKTFGKKKFNHDVLVPPAPANSYKSNFFEDFWHLNVVMWNTNNALIPDPDKNDILSSNPTQWPLVSAGLRMCGWDNKTVKFYLLGNPSVWWSSFAAIVTFTISTLVYIIRQRRQIVDMTPGNKAPLLLHARY